MLNQFKKARKRLKDLLLEFEILKITFPDNQLITQYCKVVGTEPDANHEEGTILAVVKNGYIQGFQVIREAEVIVVKNLITSDE